MYHKAVLLDESCILLIGGRKSPHEANGRLYTLHVSSDSAQWRAVETDRLSDEVQPRWRHSADIFTFQGTCLAISHATYATMVTRYISGTSIPYIIAILWSIATHYNS